MNLNDFKKQISSFDKNKITIAGLGNNNRKDDRAGLLLCEKLRNKFPEINIIKVGTTPENYLSKLTNNNPNLVIFIDAARSDSQPGTIQITNDEISKQFFSTHSYSIELISKYIHLATNATVKYLTVTAEDTGVGNNLSEKVQKGIKNFLQY